MSVMRYCEEPETKEEQLPISISSYSDSVRKMTDIVDRRTRSRMMSAVRAKNTKIEVEIRLRLFAQGFRYRLHVRDLPGTPDGAAASAAIYKPVWNINGVKGRLDPFYVL